MNRRDFEELKTKTIKLLKELSPEEDIDIETLDIDKVRAMRRKDALKYHPDSWARNHNGEKPTSEEEMLLSDEMAELNIKYDQVEKYLIEKEKLEEKSDEQEEEYVEGTDLKKPRMRKADETPEAYEDYLRDYYESNFKEKYGKYNITKNDFHEEEILDLDKKIKNLKVKFTALGKERETLWKMKIELLDLNEESNEYGELIDLIDKRTSELDLKEKELLKQINEAKRKKAEALKRQEEEKEAANQKEDVAKLEAGSETGLAVVEKNKMDDSLNSEPKDIALYEQKDYQQPTSNALNTSAPAPLVKEEAKKTPTNVTKLGKKPNITWKTVAWVAGGLAVGVVVGFVVGPGGVMIANIVAGLAKAGVSYAAKKAREREAQVILPQEVVSASEPGSKLKEACEKFKTYIKSEEGLRDISFGLTGFMVGTSIGHFAQVEVAKNAVPTPEVTPKAPTPTNPTPTATPKSTVTPTAKPTPTAAPSTPVVEATTTSPYDGIRIGQSVRGYDVTSGHDSATWALDNINAEHLNPKYVDAGSVFKRFAISNGQGYDMITTEGMSISDVMAKYGVTADEIAVDVGKGGVSQAWTSVADLLQGLEKGMVK